MKTKTFVFLTISFILISQEGFAVSNIQNNLFRSSPTTDILQQTNQDLKNSTEEFNKNNPLLKSPQELFNNEYSFKNKYIEKEQNSNTQQTFPQRKIILPQTPSSNTKRFTQENSQPKWWRQESTYEGWKFD